MTNQAQRIKLIASMRADLRILSVSLRTSGQHRAAIRADIAGEAIGELYAALTMADDPEPTADTLRPERIDEIRGAE